MSIDATITDLPFALTSHPELRLALLIPTTLLRRLVNRKPAAARGSSALLSLCSKGTPPLTRYRVRELAVLFPGDTKAKVDTLSGTDMTRCLWSILWFGKVVFCAALCTVAVVNIMMISNVTLGVQERMTGEDALAYEYDALLSAIDVRYVVGGDDVYGFIMAFLMIYLSMYLYANNISSMMFSNTLDDDISFAGLPSRQNLTNTGRALPRRCVWSPKLGKYVLHQLHRAVLKCDTRVP